MPTVLAVGLCIMLGALAFEFLGLLAVLFFDAENAWYDFFMPGTLLIFVMGIIVAVIGGITA